jgi:succinate dehydrogenase / fumarate reductase membrane anchor subunit
MMLRQERMRSPLGRARGLGSAKEGVEHWWRQRLSAVALVPLSLWFVASLIGLAGADYAEFVEWLSAPLSATLMVLLLVATFYHALLGVQVVIEDYVHVEWQKLAALVVLRGIVALLGALSIFAVLRIALGS